MDYIKGTVETTAGACEALADLIAPLCGGCEVSDPGDVEALKARLVARWDAIDEKVLTPTRPEVCFYLSESSEGRKVLAAVAERLEEIKAEDFAGFYGSLLLSWQTVKSEDWENNWKQYFHPFLVGERLLVRPSWEACDPGDRKELVIDPGMSFGTGAHATTRMVLERMEKIPLEGARVLDLGCGSGILSCASLLLGAGAVLGCDVDPAAVRASKENVKRNCPKANARFILGDLTAEEAMRRQIAEEGPYPLIVANIASDVLLTIAPYLAPWLDNNGQILLSGIIGRREEEVRNAYERLGFFLCSRSERDDWVALSFLKILKT